MYEKLIYEDELKGIQLKLVLDTFKDIEYLHIRKYYMSYDSGYVPSKEGVSIPANIDSIRSLLEALIDICAKAEVHQLVTDIINEKRQN